MSAKKKIDLLFKEVRTIKQLKELWTDAPEDVIKEAEEQFVWNNYYDEAVIFFKVAPHLRDGKADPFPYAFTIPIIDNKRAEKYSTYNLFFEYYKDMVQAALGAGIDEIRDSGEVFTREQKALEQDIGLLRGTANNSLQKPYDEFKAQKKIQVYLQFIDAVIVGESTRAILKAKENEELLTRVAEDPITHNVISNVSAQIYKKKGGFSLLGRGI